MLEFQHAHRAQVHRLQDLTAVLPPQLLEALAADAEELDLLALGDQRAGALAGKPHDRRVERPAQPALGRAHDQQVHLLASGAGEQFWRPFEADDAARDIAEHLVHVLGVGPRRLGRGLGAAQLRCRHHLHGLGDLLRRLGGGDAVAQVFQAGHLASDPDVAILRWPPKAALEGC